MTLWEKLRLLLKHKADGSHLFGSPLTWKAQAQAQALQIPWVDHWIVWLVDISNCQLGIFLLNHLEITLVFYTSYAHCNHLLFPHAHNPKLLLRLQ